MNENTEYLITTMDADTLQKITELNSFANNFSYEFKSFLVDRGYRIVIKEFTNKKHNNLHVQLMLNEACSDAVGMIPVLMKKLSSFYNFNWGFVNEVDLSLVKNISPSNKTVYIDIISISNKSTQKIVGA